MKRFILAGLLVAAAAVTVWSQPKVAILDANIPENMDPSVIVPITDKISERLVVSQRFTVLDRANVESVLKEREFQVSGLVSDQDVVTAGKYLGADFVVVEKVQKVSDTYFISAKMIAVKTGVIANQTSAQGEGKLSTLIDLAGQVGEVLAGGAVFAQSAAAPKEVPKPAVEPAPAPAPAPEPAPEPAPAPAPEPKKARVASKPASGFFGVGFFGSADTWTGKADYGSDSYTRTEDVSLLTVNLLYSGKYIQLGLGYSRTSTGSYTWQNTSSSNSGSGDITVEATYVDIQALFKLPLNLGSALTLFPLAGVEFDVNTSYTDSNGNDLTATMTSDEKDSLNHIYLDLGAGLALYLGPVAICPQFIFGYKIPSKADEDWKTTMTTSNGWSSATVTEIKLDFGVVVGIKI